MLDSRIDISVDADQVLERRVNDAPGAAAELYDTAYYRGMRGDQRLADGAHHRLYDGFLALVSDLPLPQLQVLDLGCGRGELLALMRRRGVRGAIGADFSAAAVDLSRARLARDGEVVAPGDVVCGSIDSADLFPANSFDVIFMTDVVE